MPPHSRPTADRRSAPRTPSRTAPRAARSGEWEPRPPLPSPWPEPSPLLPSLSGDARKLLETLARALATVRPLRTAHRKALPRDIADLSRLLTVDRAELHHPYWGSPGLASAYMHYFLPWNIVRLARLLAALPLPDPRRWLDRGLRPWLLDAGSGPLTLPLALWLARPDWRSLPLGVLALDTAALPLCGAAEATGLVGRTTGEAIRFGVMNSLRFEIEGYIARIEAQFEDLCVIFTGGDAKFFAKRIKNTIFANCNLVFCGLNRILEYNASEEHLG